jgi:colanic acid biosynthesis glycosyl transferase WcaI
MRILFLNQYFPPDATNTAYLLGQLCEDLARDHEVLVLAGRPSYNPEAGRYRPAGVQVRHAWSTSFSRAGMAGRLLNYATYLISALLSASRMPKPDAIVALTDPPVIGVIGLMASRRHHVPFVQVYMDIYPDVGIALRRVDNPLLVRAWRRLNQRVRSGAARVVAIGRDMQEKLQQEGVDPAKIALIPNWANESVVGPERIAEVRTAMGWTERFVVMHAGNTGLAQNLDVLVEAAQRIRDQPDILVTIVGDGAARQRLEQRARALDLPNIAFVPHVPKHEAESLVAAADLHVISLAPGLRGCVVPSKLYGILAAGKPFIAAVEPGSEIAFLVAETRCGILVETGDPGGLANAIVGVRDHPDPEMGKSGRRAFQTEYRRDKATRTYEDLLVGVTSSMSAPASF